jgi:hypothetical protein
MVVNGRQHIVMGNYIIPPPIDIVPAAYLHSHASYTDEGQETLPPPLWTSALTGIPPL